MMRTGVAAVVLSALMAACGTGLARDQPASPGASSGPGRPGGPSALSAPGGPELVARLDTIRRPAQPAMTAGLRTALVVDPCVDRDLPAPAAVDESLTVLDRSYALAASYVPPDLVPASGRASPAHRARSCFERS